jgi:Flp pilus assembly protein TadD
LWRGFLIRALAASGEATALIDALVEARDMPAGELGEIPDLAGAFETAGDRDSAERARTDLVERAPSDPAGHVELAKIREAAGDWVAAIAQWRVVTRERPGEADGWFSLAGAYGKHGDRREAIDVLDAFSRAHADPSDAGLAARIAAFRTGLK